MNRNDLQELRDDKAEYVKSMLNQTEKADPENPQHLTWMIDTLESVLGNLNVMIELDRVLKHWSHYSSDGEPPSD